MAEGEPQLEGPGRWTQEDLLRELPAESDNPVQPSEQRPEDALTRLEKRVARYGKEVGERVDARMGREDKRTQDTAAVLQDKSTASLLARKSAIHAALEARNAQREETLRSRSEQFPHIKNPEFLLEAPLDELERINKRLAEQAGGGSPDNHPEA